MPALRPATLTLDPQIGCLSLLFAVPLDSPRIAVVVSLCNVILAVWLCILLVKVSRLPRCPRRIDLTLPQRAEHDATLQNLWLTNRRVLLDNMEHIYKSLRDLGPCPALRIVAAFHLASPPANSVPSLRLHCRASESVSSSSPSLPVA